MLLSVIVSVVNVYVWMSLDERDILFKLPQFTLHSGLLPYVRKRDGQRQSLELLHQFLPFLLHILFPRDWRFFRLTKILNEYPHMNFYTYIQQYLPLLFVDVSTRRYLRHFIFIEMLHRFRFHAQGGSCVSRDEFWYLPIILKKRGNIKNIASRRIKVENNHKHKVLQTAKNGGRTFLCT